MATCPQCHGTGHTDYEHRPQYIGLGVVSHYITVAKPCTYPGCHAGHIHCCDGDKAAEGEGHKD